ncbi:hypothetical protein CALCODRAFT_499003 [Calocera cornea HHB12733]|uniref:Uncharacterized protein n=1 Tax=Calocera cornea HHB12733 TaxID=1353952 RepID=A0A165EMT6_9BASI|nr:hypothetical protein CALCODRAFT_499003 [Calocera cornea HHB12733]
MPRRNQPEISPSDVGWRSSRPRYWNILAPHLAPPRPNPTAPPPQLEWYATGPNSVGSRPVQSTPPPARGAQIELEWYPTGPNSVGARPIRPVPPPARGGPTQLEWHAVGPNSVAARLVPVIRPAGRASRQEGQEVEGRRAREEARRERDEAVVRSEGEGEQPPSYRAAGKDTLLAVTMAREANPVVAAASSALPPVYEAIGGIDSLESPAPLGDSPRNGVSHAAVSETGETSDVTPRTAS